MDRHKKRHKLWGQMERFWLADGLFHMNRYTEMKKNIRRIVTCYVCKYIYSHLNIICTYKPAVMWNLSAKLTYVQTHAITHRENKFTRNHRSLRQQCWSKDNLAEKQASRCDPNNHQNKVRQLFGTVQRRSMGNWTGYEKCVFLLSTAHFDVSYQPEMNGM